MPFDLQSKNYQSYGFLFKGQHQEDIVGLYSMGWEEVKTHTYNWHGMERDEIGKCVFQYTLSGKGAIEINGQYHTLEAGDAFLVQIPSNHRYFLPQSSDAWEFIHITLYGNEARKTYQYLQETKGHIIQVSPDSDLIKLWFTIFEEVSSKKISDSFQASTFGYAFIMELYRYAQNIASSPEKWPEAVTKAIIFMQNNFSKQIGLDDIVDASGLSKYHFTRLFHKVTTLTPIQYLTKIRIDKAIELLRLTNKSIEDVAMEVGYSNGNYFSKVFLKRIGMSPGMFRESKNKIPVDYLVID
ncbi:helix-turn-helix domain-containing protein [Lederbergia graminis]|uniref:Helix-turn-helix domain-containing protein n=1 Tax=Lederbergia graminis TaxID=735518 RepID=A0ABW0LKC8_9BACI|nr:helix-turn-helix domain-containing protein [Paenibacillus bovis]HLU22508.1 AraC family transcriptional regulator [Bacillaceae bacterium]